MRAAEPRPHPAEPHLRLTRRVGQAILADVTQASLFLLAAVIAALGLVWGDDDGYSPLAVLIFVLSAVAFLLRLRAPRLSMALAIVAILATVVDSESIEVAVGLGLLTLLSYAINETPRIAFFVTVLVGVGLYTLVVLAPWNDNPPDWLNATALSLLTSTAAMAGFGYAIRAHREAAREAEARFREAVAATDQGIRQAVTEERLRLARDLHDSVAHQLAVVNINSGLALASLRTQPERSEAALRVSLDALKLALGEMQATLQLLRDPDGAAGREERGLSTVPELISTFQDLGLDVTARVQGQPRRLGARVELTAYRVVQEALTNARKHGGGSVSLTVDFALEGLRIMVVNGLPGDGVGGAAGSLLRSGSGLGLIGMRERLNGVGGQLTAGRDAAGSAFSLLAVFPRAAYVDERL